MASSQSLDEPVELSQQLFELNNISSADAKTIVEPFVQEGNMQQEKKSNGLLVTETSQNLMFIAMALKVADQPTESALGLLNKTP